MKPNLSSALPTDRFTLTIATMPAGTEVGNILPTHVRQNLFDGMKVDGEDQLSTCYAAPAGSQKYGALVWSGIHLV